MLMIDEIRHGLDCSLWIITVVAAFNPYLSAMNSALCIELIEVDCQAQRKVESVLFDSSRPIASLTNYDFRSRDADFCQGRD